MLATVPSATLVGLAGRVIRVEVQVTANPHKQPDQAMGVEITLYGKGPVVRAEAATRFGRLFERTGDKVVAGLLEKAYRNPRNSRGGRPLFVQQRILYALHVIGGAEGAGRGQRLASGHPETKVYWARLAAASESVD